MQKGAVHRAARDADQIDLGVAAARVIGGKQLGEGHAFAAVGQPRAQIAVGSVGGLKGDAEFFAEDGRLDIEFPAVAVECDFADFARLVETLAEVQADREVYAVCALEQRRAERFRYGERERVKFAESGEGHELLAARFDKGGERVAAIGTVANIE